MKIYHFMDITLESIPLTLNLQSISKVYIHSSSYTFLLKTWEVNLTKIEVPILP
jgi:hypothetical protein